MMTIREAWETTKEVPRACWMRLTVVMVGVFSVWFMATDILWPFSEWVFPADAPLSAKGTLRAIVLLALWIESQHRKDALVDWCLRPITDPPVQRTKQEESEHKTAFEMTYLTVSIGLLGLVTAAFFVGSHL